LAHRIDGRKLGRPTDHRLALFRNLVTDLLRYERIITTEAKAREVRGLAERVITMGKRGDLHSRRRAMGFVYDRKSSKGIRRAGPRYSTRPGGYSRMVKLGRQATARGWPTRVDRGRSEFSSGAFGDRGAWDAGRLRSLRMAQARVALLVEYQGTGYGVSATNSETIQGALERA
jgi:ribosomal protein L17